jgi:hypothetical protein
LAFNNENSPSAGREFPAGATGIPSKNLQRRGAASRLKRLASTVLFVVQSETNGLVETARHKIGLNASVEWLRVMLVTPRVQFFQLLRAERSYGAFDFLDRL